MNKAVIWTTVSRRRTARRKSWEKTGSSEREERRRPFHWTMREAFLLEADIISHEKAWTRE